MRYNLQFPFTAVSGQEDLKLALILNAVNSNIGGVLISGEKGTAKSTLVRALAHLIGDKRMVELPLNITEDRLVGTLDLSSAVNKGERYFEKGLLYDANDNFLYIDEVNLLSAHVSNILSEVVSTGENIVERDGISFSHICKCILIGSMNPEEGFLRPQFLDKFGLFVNTESEKNVEIRTEIIRSRLKYENNPTEFCLAYSKSETELAEKISFAADKLNDIVLSESNLELIALTAKKAGCAGNRCEIILSETAKALCAWRNDNAVSDDDIKTAAKFVLPHRMRNSDVFEMEQTENNQPDNEDNNNNDNSQQQDIQETNQNEQDNSSDSNDNRQNKEHTENACGDYNLSLDSAKSVHKKSLGSGKRSKVHTSELTGRYIKSTIPNRRVNDIAVVPTLCQAALYQSVRTPINEMKIAVKTTDFREKKREKRTGATILFVVDASGSMGAKRRMRAVKGAVKSLLSEAYQKRDKVGVIAFRGNGAEVLLNITGSLDLAQKCMQTLSTGGKTPLADGLYKAEALLKAERIRTPDAIQYMVLISDGKTNISL